MKTTEQIVSSIEYRILHLQRELNAVAHPDTQGEFLYRADVRARLDELESLLKTITETIL
jgi:hypothetical protein